MTLTFGSLFVGIGGFDHALEMSGLSCSWQVEIEPQAVRVLKHHWPTVPVFADVCHCGKDNLAVVDVITGGFPCQDVSVAGQRAGFGGKRSSLFHEMLRIVDELRPRFLLWENVPGLLSSYSPIESPPGAVEGCEWEVEEDSDFETVLRELQRIGYCGGVTSLDAQWFGLAQQRQRLFGLFTPERFGAECCAEILSLRDRSKGNPAPSRETQTRVAAALRSRSAVGRGVNKPGRGGEDDVNLVFSELGESHATYQQVDVAANLRTSSGGGGQMANIVTGPLMAHSQEHGHAMGTQQAAESNQLVAHALCSHAAKSGDPTTDNEVVGCLNSGGNNGGFRTEPGEHLVAHALTSQGSDASEDGTGRGTPIVTVRTNQTNSNGNPVGADVSPCLDGAQPVAVFQTRIARNGRGQPSEVASALTSSDGCTHADSKPHVFGGGFGVRRLTPLECTRLMGFPDAWLDVEPPLSDSAKYRLLGNAVCPPVVKWIGRRILAALTLPTPPPASP